MTNIPLSSSPLPPVADAKTLWHYTTPQNMSLIAKSGELWATSPRHQNDQSEGIYAWQVVENAWRELRNSGLNEDARRLLDLAFTENMGETVKRSVFTLSASSSPTVAHLWKEYAAGSTGFALGLDVGDYFWAPKYRLTQILEKNDFNRALPGREGWFRVEYDPIEQVAMANHALKWLAEFWPRVGEIPWVGNPWGLYVDNVRFVVRSLLLLMKDPTYAPEQEVRFIAGRPIRAENIVLEQDDLAHLPLAVIPYLGNRYTRPGLPIVDLSYCAQGDPWRALEIKTAMHLRTDQVKSVICESDRARARQKG